MGLEELQSCRCLHLGGNHAQEIVLDTDYIHSPDFPFRSYELEGSCKFLVDLPLPMETDTDRYAVEDEGRLCKHRGFGNGFEIKLIVENTVVGNPSILERDPLPACAVRNYLEIYVLSRHDADFQLFLVTRKAPYYLFLFFIGDADFIHHSFQKARTELVEILFTRGNEYTTHVSTTGAHGKMVRPL